MPDDSSEYLKLLFDLGNPVYFSIFLTFALLLFIFFIYKYVVAPLRKKHLIEKKELELKNIKLMAMFAELDPNPLIRIDSNGIIIHSNDAAKELTKDITIEGKKIHDLLTSITFPVKDYIKHDTSFVFNQTINNKYYSILFRGISYLNVAQIYFDDLTERKMFEEELQLSQAKLRELSGHLRDTLEDERQRIARELHDSIGQNLYLIRLKLQSGAELNGKSLSNHEYEMLLNSIEISIKELREIIYNLKPKALEEMGLGLSLKMLTEKISEDTGISGTVDIYGTEERLDKKLELTLYRITQEALGNIIKHSKAKEFNIQLMNKKNSTRLLISDDGVGFDTAKIKKDTIYSSFGLLNMQERINTYNGKLKIDTSPGNGTVIITEIPKG
jgi:signal transduction histidine kinase